MSLTESQNNTQQPSEETHERKTLSRRKLLKTLIAAGGGLTVATILPCKWRKPVVEVGVLPAHAQVTPLPSQTPGPRLAYSAVCDSTPGGGDISIGYPSGTGRITNIQPYLAVISGSGPIEDIQVTMTAEAVQGSLPSFTPALPQSTTTNAQGIANFGTLDVTGTAGQTFNLLFSFAVPTGTPLVKRCGEFELH